MCFAAQISTQPTRFLNILAAKADHFMAVRIICQATGEATSKTSYLLPIGTFYVPP